MEAKFILSLFVLSVGLEHAHGQELMDLTILTEAPETMGAVCLDGSPPGYYMRRGYGEGADKWVMHIQGGGWCTSTEECYERASTDLGSTENSPEVTMYSGILSNSESVNPDFYNWNHVFLIYCDGGSFAGDREEPDTFENTTIYYRGYRNLKAIMRHLNEERGLSSATDVILTGCSAGGLAVFLHADFLRTLIVDTAKYRAFPDAGYFFDLPDAPQFNAGFTLLRNLQNIDDAIIPACRADFSQELTKCIFPPVIYNYIRTPIFVLNPQYDSVVLEALFMLSCVPPECDEEGAAIFQNYYDAFDSAVQPVTSSPSVNGYFLDTCYVHCQIIHDEMSWNQYTVLGSTIVEAFGDWYFNRSANTRLKDCPDFPCNPTCSVIPDGAVRNLANPLAFLALLVMASLA